MFITFYINYGYMHADIYKSLLPPSLFSLRITSESRFFFLHFSFLTFDFFAIFPLLKQIYLFNLLVKFVICVLKLSGEKQGRCKLSMDSICTHFSAYAFLMHIFMQTYFLYGHAYAIKYALNGVHA